MRTLQSPQLLVPQVPGPYGPGSLSSCWHLDLTHKVQMSSLRKIEVEFEKKMELIVVISWENQDKQPPVVYLDSAFYLTTNKISPYLIVSLSHTHTCTHTLIQVS